MTPCIRCRGSGRDLSYNSPFSVTCCVCAGTGNLPWTTSYHYSRKLRRIARKLEKQHPEAFITKEIKL